MAGAILNRQAFPGGEEGASRSRIFWKQISAEMESPWKRKLLLLGGQTQLGWCSWCQEGRTRPWEAGPAGGHRKCWCPVSVAGPGCLCGSDSTVVETGLSAEAIWHQCPSRQDPLREGWSRRRRQCLMLTRCGVCLLLECLICSAVASKILTVPLRTGLSTAGGDLSDSVIELKVPYVIGASQVVPAVKNLPAYTGDARDVGLLLGSGRFPGEGNGTPLQCSGLEKSMDRGAWWATVHGVAKSRT